MTITATPVAAANRKDGNKKQRVFDLVFSSTYPTSGETITASTLGLKKIEEVLPSGNLALSTDLATANPVGFDIASSGTSVVVTQYESGSSGAALAEKTGSETYATGSHIRVTVKGF